MATNSQSRLDVLPCAAAWRVAKEEQEGGVTTLEWTEVKLDGQAMEMVPDNLFAGAFRAQHQSDVALMCEGSVRGHEVLGGMSCRR